MPRTLALILLAVATPLAAAATDWLVFSAGPARGDVTAALSPPTSASFEPESSSDDSPILLVEACSSTDWSYYPDKDGSGTSCDVEFTLQKCPARSLTGGSADDGCVDVNVTNPTLSPTNTGLAGIAVGGGLLRVQAGESGTNSTQCRIVVSCAGRTR